MIILGSRALPVVLNTVKRMDTADYDVIMSVEEFSKWTEKYSQYIISLIPKGENKYKALVTFNGKKTQYEIELGFEGTSSAFLLENKNEICKTTGRQILGFFDEVYSTLPPEYLFLTKKSHIIYPVHWEKNIADYHTLKEYLGELKLDETMEKYFELRRAEAKERYKKFKTPKLNVTNEDFFSSKLAVERYFIHDDIHEMVKHFDRPVYEMMKRDFGLAKCEKDMFFQLPYEHQIRCVQEEAYTIALERYIVPQSEGWEDYKECFRKAVKRICTTLCSGWFREFAYENYPTIMEEYNPNFVYSFALKMMNREILPVEGKTLKDVPKFHIGGK